MMAEALDQDSDSTSEAGADLAALQVMAADELPALGSAAAVEPEGIPLAQEIAVLLQALAALVKPILPSVSEKYDKQTCETVGAALEPLCKKRGWLQGGFGGEYAEEIAAAIVILPLGFSTYTAAKADLEKVKAAKSPQALDAPGQEKAAAVYQTPGTNKVIIGAPIAA